MAKRKRTRVKKQSLKNVKKPGEIRNTFSPLATLTTPSGLCPFKIESVSRKHILEWVEKVLENKNKSFNYCNSVYRYWVRDTYPCNTSEHKEVQIILGEIFQEDSRFIYDS